MHAIIILKNKETISVRHLRKISVNNEEIIVKGYNRFVIRIDDVEDIEFYEE